MADRTSSHDMPGGAATTPFVYDPFDWEVQEDPYPYYRVLLDHHPVYKTPDRDWWTLSRFGDIQAAARDYETFSNASGTELDGAGDMYTETFGPGNFLYTDPPDHDRIRKVAHPRFTPRAVQEFEAEIRENVSELLDELVDHEDVDLAAEFAWRLPISTISDVFGFPKSDHRLILHWMLELEARHSNLEVLPASAVDAGTELADYITNQLDDRARSPRDDLLSLFAAAEREGRLRPGESRGITFILVLAGIDTSACLISNTLHRLAPRPDDRRMLTEQPDRIPQAVEEMIRYEAPVQGLARRATRDVVLHDVTIPARGWVWLSWAAANRDERRFENPDVLDLSRPVQRNLGFGDGIHHCIGAPLARLEAKIAFECFFSRFPGYQIVGAGQRLHMHGTRGWVHLPAVLG
jgi:cytochrome P450